MRKLLSIICYVLISLFTFQSCKKEQQTPLAEEISQDVLTKIHDLGFSTKDVLKFEDGFIIEGDIFILEADLINQPVRSSLVVANTEQYQTTIVVRDLPRTITISVDTRLNAYLIGIDEAITRYNSIGLDLTFLRVSSTSDANIKILKDNSIDNPRDKGTTAAVAGFPDEFGNPFKTIRVNQNYFKKYPGTNHLASIIAHELGHCIGFRHTDYLNRAFSCGKYTSEEDFTQIYGAVNIPGTPTEPDAGSWMLACLSPNANRVFNSNDLIALNYLYHAEICGNGIDDNLNGQIDENCFARVIIGDQVWMLKNLEVSTYRNGDQIPEVTDPTVWAGLTTGAWCYYNNNSANGAIYGKLYNWFAVNDPRGLAPLGWHVPSDAEWTTLENFIDAMSPAGNVGEKMKSIGTIEAGSGLWYAPNTNANNISGFTGLPGGGRTGDSFHNLGFMGMWWSSTESPPTAAANRILAYEWSYISKAFYGTQNGFSVRCVKD